MDQDITEHIIPARLLANAGSYDKAFELFLTAFDKRPNLKRPFEFEFRKVLSQYNDYLDTDMDAIFKNFELSLNVFPGSALLFNEIGQYLYRSGYFQEAFEHFQKSCQIDMTYVCPEKHLNSLKNHLVPRWHFRMLNDKIRNTAYEEALKQSVIPQKDKVLDIGTGTGLLAMYAYKQKPKSVTGCDGSKTMTDLAKLITQTNKTKISIVCEMSTDLDYTDTDEKYSLVVTELFDAGLLGEHVIKTLHHAWENLISKDGRVIPNRAEYFIAGVHCDFLNKRYQLHDEAKHLLNIPMLNVHIGNDDEPYDSEDVHLISPIEFVTEAQSLFKINFNDPNEVRDFFNREEPIDIELKALKDGVIDMVIGWFNLYLTDKITVTTDPRSEQRANAWQQAVFYDNIPKTVKKDEIVNAKFLVTGGKLTILPEANTEIVRISTESLRFLNDTEYLNMIIGSLGTACVYLGQMCDLSEVRIVDLCPFPVFGLMMMKRGAGSLTCYAKDENDEKFLKRIFDVHNIPLSQISVILGDEWSTDDFKGEKFHAILCHILEIGGDIDIRLKVIAEELKCKHLLPNGLFMPASIKIKAQLVCSEWLDLNNRVYDENVQGLKIGSFMNNYQVTQNFFIELSNFRPKMMSGVLEIGNVDDTFKSDLVNVLISSSGHSTAIVAWYVIELIEQVSEMSTRRAGSFMDGTVFVPRSRVPMRRGTIIAIMCCVDPDGCYKLVLEMPP